MAERWAVTWRPRRFEEVLGQSHIINFFKIILTAFYQEEKGLPVGVIFCGSSGVGKTTLARVIAASLNCDHRQGIEPCGKCPSCEQIIQGRGGIYEVDASFFGRVENIRSLRNRLGSYSFSAYQVVIIDECHMMSKEAFNVLLKLLEEPPEKVFFILVTTEVDKVLGTVRSRLLEFRFRLIQWNLVKAFLQKHLEEEGVKCEAALYFKLYRMAQYNLREVIMMIEQLTIAGNGIISEELVSSIYGDTSFYDNLVAVIQKGDYGKALEMYEEHMIVQPDVTMFINELIECIGELLKKSLQSGSSACRAYGDMLKSIYNFMSSKMRITGLSGVRLLLNDLCDIAGGGLKQSQDSKVLSSTEIISLLTNKS